MASVNDSGLSTLRQCLSFRIWCEKRQPQKAAAVRAVLTVGANFAELHVTGNIHSLLYDTCHVILLFNLPLKHPCFSDS